MSNSNLLAAAALKTAAVSDKEQLARLNQWLEVALNNMARGLSMYDSEQRLILCNDVYRQLYDLPEELTRPGTPLAEIVRFHVHRETGRDDPEAWEEQRRWIEQHVARLSRGESFSEQQHLRGGRIVLITNQPLGDGSWVDLQEDITERVRAEEKIAWLARFDVLTEVPNRFHFNEQLEKALESLTPESGLAVHWIDLDRFKEINDDLGHPAGDALLKSFGERLRANVRRPDFVGRLGGDEFAIVQTYVRGAEDARAFAERLLTLFSETHSLMGHRVDIGASIGIALAPTHATGADELLQCADMALYHAKSLGRGTYTVFDPNYTYEMRSRRRLEADLRDAVQNDQLILHYQPILDSNTKQITCCEALVRWLHPEHGLIAPSDFIPLAEETGLIVGIGEWVLHAACTEAATWPDHVKVSVNLSPSQFSSSDLYETVVAALSRSGLDPHRLELEITETVLLCDDAKTVETLHKLRTQGVCVALDDFGTAFASLSYLRSFPFDTIKIDRSFVRDLPTESDSLAIIEAVTGLARKLKMRSVVEGIETHSQLDLVTRVGCDGLQGYYFDRPLAASDLAKILNTAGANPNSRVRPKTQRVVKARPKSR
jgi:diguanylate cyclase (GGDEF)-like protein